jgi:leader peptidase (prepilin peptidase)/N-methyltransferase
MSAPAILTTLPLLLAPAGWLAGMVANRTADTLPAFRATESPTVAPRSAVWLQRRRLWLKVALALTFALIGWRFGATPLQAALVCLYAAWLAAVLVIDLEHRLVLNMMLAPAAAFALAASVVPGGPDPLQALKGGAAAFGIFFVLGLLGRGALGFGDVKLAGVLGLMAGYPLVLTALVLGVVFGGLAAAFLMLTRRATRKSTLAYAPYLAVGLLSACILRGPF